MRSCAPIAVWFLCLVSAIAPAQDRGVGGTSSAASAEAKGARVALVMGNGAYPAGPLKNPVNDAKGIAEALRACGFDVILKTDCDFKGMGTATDQFGDRIRNAQVALFFYAGHGIQVNGENYLVPVDADIKGESEVRYDCLNAGQVLAKMQDAGCQVNILILDACRNNPFARSFRSNTGGLAPMDASKGTIIAYSTAPGRVAADGDGANSIYTASLLEHIRAQGKVIEEVFKQVRAEVATKTGDKQVPWENTSLVGSFYFVPGDSGTSAPPSMPASSSPLPPPPAESLGGLQVRVNVSNALVKVNGEERGPASPGKPANVGDLAPGKVMVEVLAEGYEAEPKEFEVEEGKWTTATFKLSKVMVVKPEEPKRPPTVSVGGEAKAGDVRAFEGGEFAWIPAGSFEMGNKLSVAATVNTYGNEDGLYADAPRHSVTLTKGFWMGTHEVTNGEFDAFVKATEYQTDAEKAGKSLTWNPSRAKGEETTGASWRNPEWKVESKLPVVLVSWNDAQAYAKWLNGKGDGTYRLPTEAEWEYAARAGTTTEFFWGDSAKGGRGYLNARDETPWPRGKGKWDVKFPFKDGYYFVAPVGSFKANSWGLYDILGNVDEWCQDYYGDYPSGSVTDAQGPASGQFRVMRGGSWLDDPGRCRAASRGRANPDDRGDILGFRLLRVQD